MKRAKYSEVPFEYRRNYKKEIFNGFTMIPAALMFDAVLLFIVLWS